MANFFKKYWKKFLNLGISVDYDVQENTKIKIMNIGFLFSSFGCLVAFFQRLENGYEGELIIRPLVICIFLLLLPLFSLFKKHRLGWHLGILFFILTVTFASNQRPVLYTNYLIFGPITFLIIYLFENNKLIQYAYLAFITLNIVAFTWLSTVNIDPTIVYPFFNALIVILVVMVFQYYIITLTFEKRVERENELDYAISLKEAALNANKDATIIINNKREITDWNAYYQRMWSFTDEEMQGLNSKKLLAKINSEILNPETVINKKNIIRENPLAYTCDKLYLKNGKIIESYSQPQILKGKVVGRVYNYRDVTLEIQTEKRIIESESRFRSFYEDSPLGVVILEDFGVPFRNVNQRICDIFGYTQEEIVQLQLGDIYGGDDIEKHITEFKNITNKEIRNFTLLNKYQKKSGEMFWGNVNVSIRRDKKNRIQSVILMLEDVNEKILQEQKIKNLLRELKRLNENLEQKVKTRTIDLKQSNEELLRSNQDLEQFAYIASHDLQEPLRMVGNFVQLLERQYEDKMDQEGKQYIHYIVDGVTRMSKLIQNLLKYSRVGRKEAALRPTQLDKIVAAKLFGLQQKIKETEAEVIVKDIPKNIFCEPDQIGMVFYNLITNAIKFNTHSPKIEIGFQDKVEDYLFYVKDNGIGIEQVYDNKVFEIFKRLHRREDYEGTGIGLALCKKIIARHGGRIWFESEPNKGTIFYFTISKSLKNEKHVPFDTNLVS